MEREKFGTRLGFILVSAGCAIGLGNVWRFPYITGEYGGAAFVIMYLVFLAIFALPALIMEFAAGRASQRSIARSYDVLEPAGTKWHAFKWLALAGNYLLMMFYTTVGGWMLAFVVKAPRASSWVWKALRWQTFSAACWPIRCSLPCTCSSSWAWAWASRAPACRRAWSA